MLTSLLTGIHGLTPTQWISIAAFVVSLTSLSVSMLGYLRDRPSLKIEACRYRSGEAPGYIEIKAVNVGRRPIYLVMLWGEDTKGPGIGRSLDHGGPGIKLGEHEFKRLRVTHLPRGVDEFDAAAMTEEDDCIEFHRMWIEDSLGKRHNVPKMTTLLPELRADYKEWCDRTGYWKTPTPLPKCVEPCA